MANDINDIYSFYDSLLMEMGLETKADGSIWVPGKTPSPVTIQGKKLVLPLKSRLKNPSEDEIFFHPLCEQMQRYESEVFKAIKRALTIRLISSISTIGVGLIKLQDDPMLQRKLSIEQIEVIKNISTVDKNSGRFWTNMLMYPYDAYKFRADKWPVNIFLKRNGKFAGNSFRRVASVSFPFVEAVLNGERFHNDAGKDIFSNKAYVTFGEVFQSIFPNAKDPGETYNAGWNDPVAPYFSALLLSVDKMATRLNHLCDLFAEVFEEIGVDVGPARIKCEWMQLLNQEDLKDYTLMSGVIPQLKGNTGATSEDEAEEQPKEEARPTRRERSEAPPVKEVAAEEKPKAEPAKTNTPTLSEAEQKLLDAAIAKRKAWKAEQEEIARDDEERRKRREERQREEDERRDDRSRDRDRGRDETPPWDDEPKKVDGKLSASDLFRPMDRDHDRDDRGRGRDCYDDRDRGRGRDRDYRRDDRDRDYDRGRDRYDDRDRDFFDRGRDRDYRRDDRGSPWGGGRRDDRDRGYGRRDDRGSPWGRR